MPRLLDIEGVKVEIPEEATPEQIQQFLDENHNKPSAAEAFGGHLAAGIAPGAGFMQAAIPGAEAGAGIGTIVGGPIGAAVGGTIGGMVTGMAGSSLVQKAQKGILNAVDPGWGEEVEQGLRKQEATHPWASMAGDVASMGASARTLPETGFKMAQLPMRAALGAGMGAAMPILTTGQLPTAPDIAGGALMFGLFAEARGTEAPKVRVPATPEQREQRQSAFAGALQDQGMDLKQVVPGAIPGRPNDVMHTLPDGSVVVSADQFHRHLEKYLAEGKTVEEGIATMIQHEAIHEAVPDEEAAKVWNSMTKAEQWMLKRLYHGPKMGSAQPLTPEGYGHEAIRFFLEREGGGATEYTFGSKDEINASRILGAIESAVRKSRELLGTDASQVQKDALQRMLDKVKVSKEEIRKGVKSSLEQKPPEPAAEPVKPEPVVEPDKTVSEQSPPAAPTEGAQPAQEATGIKAPPGAATPEGPAATPPISATADPVKTQELQAISKRINELQRQPFTLGNVKEMKQLTQQEYKLKSDLGQIQGRQGEAKPMAAKDAISRAKEVRDMDNDEFVKEFPRGVNVENFDLGETADKETVYELKKHRDSVDKELTDLRKDLEGRKSTMDDLKKFQTLATKRQYFSEAVQVAPKEVGGEGRITIGAEQRAAARQAKPMAAKEPALMDEKQVLVRIASALHNSGLDPDSRKATFNELSDLVMGQPKENWAPMLTQIESQFASKQISETERQLDKMTEALQATHPGARVVDPAAIDQKVKDIFGGLDRQGLDARMIFELNHEPEVVPGGTSRKVKDKVGGRKGEEVTSEFREPKYNYRGRWPDVLKAIKERDPSMPESVIRDRYVNRVHQFLAYAPAETLRRLIITSGAADRFLGREIVTDEEGKRVVRYTRTIPEPNLEPAVREMGKAPSQENPTEFEKFCLAKGISVEKGKQLLEEYKADWGRKMLDLKNREEALKSKYAPPKGATKEQEEAMRKEGRAAQAELNQLKKDMKEGAHINQTRRDKAVNFLADWLIDESAPPEAMPHRGDVALDQIWFDHPDGHQGYREFTTEQGDNSLLLREYLGKGAQVPGKTASKFTRGVTVVVGPDKNVSALSTYRHPTNGQVMIYDPTSAPGEKNRGYVRLNKVLAAGYKVKSYMLVYDPVTDFHQKWTPEGERSAENVFDSQIGTQADLQSRGKMAALTSLIGQGVPNEGAEHDDVGDVTPESMYALNAWLHSKGGQTWGFFGTDPQALIRGPITSVEADALYRAFKDNKVQSVEDWDKVFSRMQSDRRIAESKPMAEMFRLSPWEYCFTSAIEKIARKRYRELVTGTGHYGPDPKTGFPDPEATGFREKIKKYPPLPKGFAERYVQLKGEEADKMWATLSEDQQTRYRLIEFHRQNELLNALQYAYDTAKEVQAQHVSEGGAGHVEVPVPTSPDTLAFRQRAIADYGDTARREVEQDAVRKTVSRQYTGRPVPRELGKVPKPGEPLSARGLTEQVPLKGKTKLTPQQQRFVQQSAARQFPGIPRPPFPALPLGQTQVGKPAYGGAPPKRFAPATGPLEGKVSMQQSRGFVPNQNPPGRNLLRQPGTEQLLMRKIQEQSNPMASKDDPRAMYSKGHGVANVYQREMQEQGRATIDFKDPDSAPLATKEQMIQEGRDLVLSGKIHPVLEMVHAKETAKKYGAPYNLNPQNIAAWRYHDYRLQQLSDALIDQRSPEAEEATKISNEWHKDFNEMAKAPTAHSMHVMQGYSVVGPGDMQSITFVRRMYERARGIAEGYEEGEEYDLTPDEQQWVTKKVNEIKGVTAGVEGSATALDKAAQKGTEVTHDKGNQIAIAKATQQIVDIRQRAREGLKGRKPGPFEATAMAQKEGEGAPPKLADEDAVDLVDMGMAVMADLSANGKMSDSNWRKAMVEELNHPSVMRPDLEIHLDHIRALSEKTRMDFVNNVVGTGDPYKSAREHFTRKQPTVDESIAAIRRALATDPHATTITPMEAYHVWNYLRNRFFNADKPEWDIRTIREKAGQELGISANRLFKAMSSNRSMREVTDELLKKMRDEQRVRSQATNWLKNLEYPWWFRTLRAFPRLFFFDKILGHGLVPLITHSSNMLFNPYAWKTYFKAWPEMYKMAITGGTIDGKKMGAGEYHDARMQELMGHERFEWWKKRGLEHDPFKFSDDYLIEWAYNLFEDKGIGGKALGKLGIPGREFLQAMIGGRSFDVLKQLRYARAEQWLNSVPEHLRTKEMGNLIAESVNHATGIVNKNFGEAGNWLMFAPKLEASRWAWMFRDTIKAADYWRKIDATLEEKSWAKTELKQKAAILGMYWGMLGLNQGFLKMFGSDQEINATDPTKADFMQFKAAGFKVGVMSPIIGIYRLFANLMHDTVGERSKFEKLTSRQRAVGERMFDYARGKASPIASAGLEMATAQSTYPTRPLGFLPWSEGLTRKQRLSGMTPYTAGEYAAQTFTPIPLEEVFRETWGEQGVDSETMNKWIRALVIGGTMSATGARVSSDTQR